MKRAILVSLLATSPALPDTVTTSDHLSVNGALMTMTNGVIQLEVGSRAGKELRWIPIKDVAAIEFNSTVFNAGGPPKLFGIKPPVEQPSKKTSEPPVPAQTIVLRGGEYKPCKLVRIDGTKVYCDGAQYSRGFVLRILTGGK